MKVWVEEIFVNSLGKYSGWNGCFVLRKIKRLTALDVKKYLHPEHS